MSVKIADDFKKTRCTYTIRPSDLSKVLCHRHRRGSEEYLVQWRTEPELSEPAVAICSWHGLDELTRSLHLIQIYVESQRGSNLTRKPAAPSLLQQNSRKRKSPDSDPVISRDELLGVLTPTASSDLSRATSEISVSSSSDSIDPGTYVYNGILEKKDGWIVAKRSKHPQAATTNSDALPTTQMVEEAARTPVTQAERAIREAFYRKLRQIPNLSLENKVDSSTPSLDFKFVKNYVLGYGVYRADAETYEGCKKPCRPNMGQYCGCEYPRLCSCLEYAAVNEHALEKEESERFQKYVRQKAAGIFIDTSDLPKRFPYHTQKSEHLPQTLVEFYRNSRHAIYECNINCNCGPVCKSRVVQKGRKVPLTIFKTANRGWGLFCREDLIKGEFIDTYLGEIITNEEADRRESQASTKEKASYLYSLDKFVEDDPDLTVDNCYVVDGQYMGGPTRFINHSCEPNCRQFTVSYNKHDLRIYDLAFFAIEDIPKGTELTFDYVDPNEEEEEGVIRKREEAARDPSNLEKIPCNCGEQRCRGYLWV